MVLIWFLLALEFQSEVGDLSNCSICFLCLNNTNLTL